MTGEPVLMTCPSSSPSGSAELTSNVCPPLSATVRGVEKPTSRAWVWPDVPAVSTVAVYVVVIENNVTKVNANAQRHFLSSLKLLLHGDGTFHHFNCTFENAQCAVAVILDDFTVASFVFFLEYVPVALTHGSCCCLVVVHHGCVTYDVGEHDSGEPAS